MACTTQPSYSAKRDADVVIKYFQSLGKNDFQLLKTHKPVTSQHLANWLKEILIFLGHNLSMISVLTSKNSNMDGTLEHNVTSKRHYIAVQV